METAPYLRICEIARGGMGFVELVVRREGRFERWCARKRLHHHFRDDESFRAMFLDEARLAGSVRHPNVASVLDVGEDDDGPFLIMDYVDGLPLSRLVASASATGHPLPVQLCVRVALEAARGLHAAHEALAGDGRPLGLVHRDVSPQNILVAFDGSVRVTDFGIAKAFGNTARTSTGVLKGNLGYLSPEQLRFEEPDRRSDLFSLGVVLYELLAGQRLYAGKDGLEGARRILNEPPPDIANLRRDVPPALVELHFELVAKDRERRPATALEVASRLESILARLIDEEGPLDLAEHMRRQFGDEQRGRAETLKSEVARVTAEHERAAVRPGGSPRRRGRLVTAIVALALAGAAAAAILVAQRGPAPGGVPGAGPRTLWAGGWHTCGRQGRDLFCWGRNNVGQLGNGQTTDYTTRQRAKEIAGPVSVGLGYYHTCACTEAGRTFCWGQNLEGQLGVTEAPTPTKTPLAVPIDGCAQVAAGSFHTCVLDRAGRVACFGENSYGQVGAPPAVPARKPSKPYPMWSSPSAAEKTQSMNAVRAPLEVAGLSGVIEIGAGQDFTCARLSGGAVHCFGANAHGELGDGTTADRHRPSPVRGLSDAVGLAVGRQFACARRATGRVACWGFNDYGQLGNGSTLDSSEPVEVPHYRDVVQIAAGRAHACALRRNGQLICWGSNIFGERGHGIKAAPLRGTPVAEIPRFLSVTAGDVHACGRHALGVSCWGRNSSGQLGDGTAHDRLYPVSVHGAWE